MLAELGLRKLWLAIQMVTPGLLVIIPVLVVWAIPFLRHRDPRSAGRLLLAAFGLSVLVMALLQRRYAYYLAVPAVFALVDVSSRAVGIRWRRRGGVPASLLASVLLVGVVGGPVLAALRRFPEAFGPEKRTVYEDLVRIDPPEHDPWEVRPGSAVQGSVFSPWDDGHYVTFAARRPAAADPFANGWERQCRLYTAEDDSEAFAILSASGSRYLVTRDLRGVLPLWALAANRGGNWRWWKSFAARVHESPSGAPVPFLRLALETKAHDPREGGRSVARIRVWRVIQPQNRSGQ